jgi:hypothetical protein
VLVAVLSYWPIRNMLSRRQLMNFSFNRLHFVGTYGRLRTALASADGSSLFLTTSNTDGRGDVRVVQRGDRAGVVEERVLVPRLGPHLRDGQ